MSKSPYDIIRTMVEMILIPKYPYLKIHDIDSYRLTSRREYDVRFITKSHLNSETQMEIDTELKNLFKLAALDEYENEARYPNIIAAWFKTPRQKDFSFHSSQGYQHI